MLRSAVLGFALGLSSTQALAIECPESRLQTYEDLIRPIPSAEMVGAHGPGDPMAPPPDPDVGDSWLWYTWLLGGFPVAEQKVCTVRGEGEHVYIVVEDSQWNTNVNQADVDAMLEAWDNSSLGQWPEQGIYDLVSSNFGPVPDMLDNDPKVYVLYYDFDVNSDGFFWAFDMYPDGSQDFASNETEVLYMNSSDFDPGGDYLISVQSHEFQHMIHWLADDNESPWVNEGCSELAMWLYGLPDNVVTFPNVPDNNLTSWTGNFADYVKTYLWTLYFYERYGGQASILDLVAQPSNSFLGYQATLTAMGYTQTFAQVVADWVVANYLDDTSFLGGRYGYVGEDLPPFTAVTRSSYPIPPTNQTVNHFAADYVKMINGIPQRLRFDGGDTSDWAPQVIRFATGSPLSVETIPLDSFDAGTYDLPDFGSGVDEVVFVIANVSSGGSTAYSYSTEDVPAGALDPVHQNALVSWGLPSVNPFADRAVLQLLLGAVDRVQVSVHAIDGKTVRSLHDGPLTAGTHSIEWNGRDAGGAVVPGGVYFVRAVTSDGAEAVQRLVHVR